MLQTLTCVKETFWVSLLVKQQKPTLHSASQPQNYAEPAELLKSIKLLLMWPLLIVQRRAIHCTALVAREWTCVGQEIKEKIIHGTAELSTCKL